MGTHCHCTWHPNLGGNFCFPSILHQAMKDWLLPSKHSHYKVFCSAAQIFPSEKQLCTECLGSLCMNHGLWCRDLDCSNAHRTLLYDRKFAWIERIACMIWRKTGTRDYRPPSGGSGGPPVSGTPLHYQPAVGGRFPPQMQEARNKHNKPTSFGIGINTLVILGENTLAGGKTLAT